MPTHDHIVEVLQAAILHAGYQVSGATDPRAAEHGEPVWVCNARSLIAELSRRPKLDEQTAYINGVHV